MPNDSRQTTSVWMQSPMPALPQLNSDASADVCIIGAGISGLTTAYFLAKAGRDVIVIDDGAIGSGETSRTTAHITAALDDRYYELIHMFGQDHARQAASSHSAAIDMVERIVKDEAIDCDFKRVDGYLYAPARSPNDAKIIERELQATQQVGLKDVSALTRLPLSFLETGPCLKFPRQGQFHPLKYLSGLMKSIQAAGGRLYSHVHADKIEGGKTVRVAAQHGPAISARAAVVATNTPVNTRIAIHISQAPYRTYVIGMQVPKGSVPEALYWDTLEPYHYIRIQNEPDYDLLIVGGEDHKTGQPPENAAPFWNLETWTRERFPMSMEVAYHWSGQVMEPVDGLALIGKDPTGDENVYIATGYSGNGMTHGTIAGKLLADLITGRENPWAALYDPSRKTAGAAGEFIRENVNYVEQYADWLKGGDVSDVTEIAPGQGAVIRHGITKIAAYRDEKGVLHAMSAECPHAGCVIGWNNVEHTWDCPCHGSRFDATGHVVNGPANKNLSLVDLKEKQD